MKKINDTYIQIVKNTGILLIPLIVVLLVIGGDKGAAIRGLLFGAIFSLLSLRLLALTLNKAVMLSPEKARVYVASRYFLRYGLTFIVLFVAIKADNINIITTILGLFLTKIVILFSEIKNPRKQKS